MQRYNNVTYLVTHITSLCTRILFSATATEASEFTMCSRGLGMCVPFAITRARIQSIRNIQTIVSRCQLRFKGGEIVPSYAYL